MEIVDERTSTFYFKEWFIDFLELYASEASGASFIVPTHRPGGGEHGNQ